MSKFVQFLAKGIIYEQDKKGRPCGVKEYRKGRGRHARKR